jgi:hypothetical protein
MSFLAKIVTLRHRNLFPMRNERSSVGLILIVIGARRGRAARGRPCLVC